MAGLLDGWIAGWLDCWMAGLLDCWIARWLDGWIASSSPRLIPGHGMCDGEQRAKNLLTRCLNSTILSCVHFDFVLVSPRLIPEHCMCDGEQRAKDLLTRCLTLLSLVVRISILRSSLGV
jgi:hypothetical protein